MPDPQWKDVRPGDYIEAGGKVHSVEHRKDGTTVFTVRDADLLEHEPAPPPPATRPWSVYFSEASTTGTTYLYQGVFG